MKKIEQPFRLATVLSGDYEGQDVNVCAMEDDACCCVLPDTDEGLEGKMFLLHKEDLRFWVSVKSVSTKKNVTSVSR